MNNDVKIHPWLHSACSYLIALTLLSLVFSFFITPSIKLRNDKFDRINFLASQLETTQHRLSLEQSRTESTEPDTADLPQRSLLPSDNEALAVATLQNIVKQLTSKPDIDLASSAFKREPELDSFQRVTLSLRLRMSVNSLVDMLYQLENHPVLLHVNSINIQSRHRNGRVLASLTDELEVRMDIASYYAKAHAE